MIRETIADLLRADPMIGPLAIGGVYDHEIRTTGYDALPAITGPASTIRTFVIVDDGGEYASPFIPFMTPEQVIIRAFATRSTTGRKDVATIMERSRYLLDGWQDDETGTQVFFANRLGQQIDDALDGSVSDRMTCTLATVVASRRWE